MDVAVYFPDKRRRDVDNLNKSLGDALQHCGLIADDCLIRDWRIWAAGYKPGGEIVVTLEALGRNAGAAACVALLCTSGPLFGG